VLRALLLQCTWRHWKLAPKRSLLLVALLGLGVAVFFSIRLANRAAVASFASFTRVVSQQTDAVLSAPAGTLPESVLESLGQALAGSGVEILPIVEVLAAAPRGDAEASIGSRPPRTLLGVDLVSLQNLLDPKTLDRKWFDQKKAAKAESGQDSGNLWQILNLPNAAFCAESFAQRENLHVGSKLPLMLNDRQIELEICGLIPSAQNQPAPPANLLVLDLPALQTLAGKPGQLDRVEFLFPKGTPHPPLLERIRSAVGDQAVLRTTESSQAAAEGMTRGFRLNLTILSLLGLVVGLYLIFQALDAAVVKRRGETAILRALGVGAREIRRAWICEAALLGLAGGLVGVLGGWALAQGTVRVVSQTVNALYYASNVEAAGLHFGEAALAVVLAVLCSVLAGWLPARAAAATPPAQLLTRGNEGTESHWRFPVAKAGVLLAAVAWGLAWLPPVPLSGGGRFPLAGYASALLTILGGGLLAGEFLGILGRWAAPLARRSAPIQLAGSHLRHPTGRHRWAVAGLLCALTMTGGMTILVSSFESSVSRWIQRTLQADLYLTSDANQSATSYNRIPESTWRKIAENPGVAETDVALIVPMELAQGPVRVVGTGLAFAESRRQFTWLIAPTEPAVFDARANGGFCFVSEAFQERFGLGVGAKLQLPSPGGPRAVQIAGVYSDFGDERGVVMVERQHLAEWFHTTDASTLSLVARPGTEVLELQAELRREFPGLAIFSNVHLRKEVMRIFRQTFAITYALEAIGVIVALLGLGTTLASVLLERRAELTTLRALGMGRQAMAKATAWEGVGIALGGSLGGLLASVALGRLLIFVINKQTFGWTLQPVFPLRSLTILTLGVVSCAALVAWTVGRWGSQLPADREE
jgi:putative ABC transport system permease protein